MIWAVPFWISALKTLERSLYALFEEKLWSYSRARVWLSRHACHWALDFRFSWTKATNSKALKARFLDYVQYASHRIALLKGLVRPQREYGRTVTTLLPNVSVKRMQSIAWAPFFMAVIRVISILARNCPCKTLLINAVMGTSSSIVSLDNRWVMDSEKS